MPKRILKNSGYLITFIQEWQENAWKNLLHQVCIDMKFRYVERKFRNHFVKRLSVKKKILIAKDLIETWYLFVLILFFSKYSQIHSTVLIHHTFQMSLQFWKRIHVPCLYSVMLYVCRIWENSEFWNVDLEVLLILQWK